MTKKSILAKFSFIAIALFFFLQTAQSQKVSVTTNPSSAQIYVDGKLMGTGNAIVVVRSNECLTVEVKQEGYFTEVRTYCKKRGVSPPPKTEYIQLKQDEASIPAVVAITTTPQTAKIFVNGVSMGQGSLAVTIAHGDCVTVEIREEGFIPETRDYCKKKGVSLPPKTDYFKLQPDESYTSSIQSDIANNELILNVKRDRSKEEAWKIIVSTILGKFDVLENNDEKLGYLRTSWIGVTFKANTVRMRVIVKLSSDDPLAYKIKFVSEASGRSGTSFSADEQYAAFGRILKKYDGFLEEITTKLKN